MNVIYVVVQVSDPLGFDILGVRSINTNPEDAIMDRQEAEMEILKSENGWPHWKILMYQLKLMGVID